MEGIEFDDTGRVVSNTFFYDKKGARGQLQ